MQRVRIEYADQNDSFETAAPPARQRSADSARFDWQVLDAH
jgi:hypothetical protein